MKTIKILNLLAVAMLFSLSLNAQKNYKLEADVSFSGLKYYQAIDLYKKAYTKEKSKEVKSEILFKIAECYRLKEDGTQAAVWYSKAITAKYDDPIAILYLANIYKYELYN